jgi:hypothetical protein
MGGLSRRRPRRWSNQGVSSSAITVGGAAEDERMKRLGADALFWRPAGEDKRCMVGTAVYQVGLVSSNQPKNLKASKPGLQTTDAPAPIEESRAPMRPWMWNKGMTLRQRSSGVSASERMMLPAEVVRLR